MITEEHEGTSDRYVEKMDSFTNTGLNIKFSTRFGIGREGDV